MAKKAATARERRHMDAVQALNCLICGAPAEIHHVRSLAGQRITRNHMLVLSLCPLHHRLGGMGVAFHAGSRTWQSIHGTEAELLNRVETLLREIA